MIPKETVDKIIDTARIEEVVGDFVSLKRRGASFVACCPFHNEKTPSFYVTPSKGIFKCFGCGKSGTAVKFVMEHESMTYPEALKFLAKKYGIEVNETEESAEEIIQKQKTESLYLVSEFASKYFIENLKKGEGKDIGYAYFKSRGLEDETIEKYGLGWANKSRKDLSETAISKGYKEEYLIETGLIYKNNDGSLTDRFYERVMFPIHSASGRVIAFGGRTLKSGHVAMKYVNTPTTDIYIKEKSLYGIWFAKGEIGRRDKCFLVEGYLDVLSMHQLGITNVVASSGTSLTIEQIRMIKKFSSNITIMYDGDSAGIKAALRGINLILQEGLNVKILLIPDGDDPDSYAKKHSKEEVEAFIEKNEQDFINFKTEILKQNAGNDPIKKVEMINDIADTISLIPDAIKRSVYAQNISDSFSMDSGIIFDRINKSRSDFIKKELKEQERQIKYEEKTEEQYKPDNIKPKKDLLENELLAACEKDFLWFILKYGTHELEFPVNSELAADNGILVADFIRDNLNENNYIIINSIYKQIYDAYYELYDREDELSQEEIIKELLNGPNQDMADRILELTQEKYNLSIKNLKNSLSNIGTILTNFVPRSIMMYHIKRLLYKNEQLTESLKNEADSSKQIELLNEIQKTAILRKKLEEKLGMVI